MWLLNPASRQYFTCSRRVEPEHRDQKFYGRLAELGRPEIIWAGFGVELRIYGPGQLIVSFLYSEIPVQLSRLPSLLFSTQPLI